jgi:hypothetical protein
MSNERAIQIEERRVEALAAKYAPPKSPEYETSTPRLKKFGGDMLNISYPEMVQLSETLAFHLHAVAGVTVGPHDLASAFFKTVETMNSLPTEKPAENTSSDRRSKGNTW